MVLEEKRWGMLGLRVERIDAVGLGTNKVA